MKKFFSSFIIVALFSINAQGVFAFSLFKSKKITDNTVEVVKNENDSSKEISKSAQNTPVDNTIEQSHPDGNVGEKRRGLFNFRKNKTDERQVNEVKDSNEAQEEIHIVEPEKKPKKITKRRLRKEAKKESKRKATNEKAQKESSKEAEGMYETKFPAINSHIEYTQMNGEVTLSDCIKLAISHHPAIVSAISNAQIYESRIGQAWANYFPTINAGLSYSRNDMLNTMGNSVLCAYNKCQYVTF